MVGFSFQKYEFDVQVIRFFFHFQQNTLKIRTVLLLQLSEKRSVLSKPYAAKKR